MGNIIVLYIFEYWQHGEHMRFSSEILGWKCVELVFPVDENSKYVRVFV